MICQHCKKEKPDVRRTRQHTQYADDDRNFVILCGRCREENDEYWNDMWAEYYQNCM